MHSLYRVAVEISQYVLSAVLYPLPTLKNAIAR